jgi:hypothetical protein
MNSKREENLYSPPLGTRKASPGSGFVFGVASDGRSGGFVWGRA